MLSSTKKEKAPQESTRSSVISLISLKKLNTDRDGVLAWARDLARIETEKYKKETQSLSSRSSP